MSAVANTTDVQLLRHLADRAAFVRHALFAQIEVAGSGHYGSALSIVEIAVALYYDYLRIDPSSPGWRERDRFVLSKGHACSAIYPILADLGFFSLDWLDTFTRLGSNLGDHPDLNKVPGFDFSSGSLGHGLSVAVGMAEGLRLAGSDTRVVCLLGDGELNEGQVWEAAAYAAHRHLGQLLAIVDVNGVSVDGSTEDVLRMEPLADKWSAFGWCPERVDGHDLRALRAAYGRYDERRSATNGRPTVLLADTIAGKGVSFIEGMAEWHVGYLGGIDRERADADTDRLLAQQLEEFER